MAGISSIEIGEGFLIVRIGNMSMTILAEVATVFNVDKKIPARRVLLSRAFFDDTSDFIDSSALADGGEE